MVKSYTTKSPSQTRKLGEELARDILKKKTSKAVVIGLLGELGSGKTTFLQGFARRLGVRERVLSPTFVLMRKFKVQKSFNHFYHIDCYRLQKPKEILDIGFKEIISNSKNIAAIEWAEKIKRVLPPETIVLKFEFVDENKRKISLKNTKKEISSF